MQISVDPKTFEVKIKGLSYHDFSNILCSASLYGYQSIKSYEAEVAFKFREKDGVLTSYDTENLIYCINEHAKIKAMHEVLKQAPHTLTPVVVPEEDFFTPEKRVELFVNKLGGLINEAVFLQIHLKNYLIINFTLEFLI